MKILLGIQVLDRPRTFEKCIKLLLACNRRNDVSIILVNNNSNDETCDTIEKYKKDVDMVIHHPWNMGYCFGINSWMQHREEGQSCGIVDQDMLMHSKDWVTIVDSILADPNIGAVAGRRPSAWIDREDKRQAWRTNLTFEKLNGRWLEVPKNNILVGPIVIYKGEVLDRIGYQNEATGYEDLDMPFRLKALGYREAYIPDIFLYQIGNPNVGDTDVEEVCKHPQLNAHQDLMKIRAQLHQEMIRKYQTTGKVYCGTRWLSETMNDPEYTRYSDENFAFHRDWGRK